MVSEPDSDKNWTITTEQIAFMFCSFAGRGNLTFIRRNVSTTRYFHGVQYFAVDLKTKNKILAVCGRNDRGQVSRSVNTQSFLVRNREQCDRTTCINCFEYAGYNTQRERCVLWSKSYTSFE